MKTGEHKHMTHSEMNHGNTYRKLLLMAVLSFISMYVLMYAMVDRLENVLPNLNQFYMAGLMTSPMIIIELILMRTMYTNKKFNIIAYGFSGIALIFFFLSIQNQSAVSDRQFLRSMIPHHAAALLMGKEAKVHDPEIKELIQNIITSQQKEIDQMKAKLKQLDN